MPDTSDADRAKILAGKALKLISSGQKEEGTRALREAAALAPDNNDVAAAFSKIQHDDSIHLLLKHCHGFVNGDEEATESAIRYLERSDVQIPPEVGRECATLLLSTDGSTTPFPNDELVGLLLRQSLGARCLVAGRFVRHTTKLFFQLWDTGNGAIDGFIQAMLDPLAWASEPVRNGCKKDGFRLFVSKLIEAGQEHQARAMKGIARLLADDAEGIQRLVDQDTFEALLSSLDQRLPVDLRSQATLAVAKYMEVAQETAQGYLTHFITFRIEKQTREDLIVAFSVATSIFPIVSSMAATLFLTEGFVESLAPMAKAAKNAEVEGAILSMMSAACIDQSCREAIRKHCLERLKSIVRDGGGERKEKAALILAKTAPSNSAPSPAGTNDAIAQSKEVEELVGMFKGMITTDRDTSKQSSIEGLAYASLQPKIKQTLARDTKFLKDLINTLKSTNAKSPLMFGGLSIFVNLTNYLPNLSEEQKRMGQLKAYANASKTKNEPDPLDDEAHVTVRCKTVLDAGIIPLLVHISKAVSPTALSLIIQIIFSLSKTPQYRGQLAQQGAIKLLLTAYASISTSTSTSTTNTPATDSQPPTAQTTAHALARILISTNPNLTFTSSLPLTSAIRPLITLLFSSSPSPSYESLTPLSTFESLLALTNLASTTPPTRDLILTLSFPILSDLLLSPTPLIQRATVELLCNLMASPLCVAKFADGSPNSKQNLHILLALADIDDYATRRAAGGALAVLTEWEGGVEGVVKRERGIRVLVGLCKEEEGEIVHRGVVCVWNVLNAPGKVAGRAREMVRKEGGVEVLKGVIKGNHGGEIVEIARETLKVLEG